MESIGENMRERLEAAVQQACEIAEKGAREALDALSVSDAKPLNDKTQLRERLRARGRAAGDVLEELPRSKSESSQAKSESSSSQRIDHLSHIMAYEHWHRMLFARLLAENALLMHPDSISLSLNDIKELAQEKGTNVWALAGEWAKEMLPEIFRSDDPVLEIHLAPETQKKLEQCLDALPSYIFTAEGSLSWMYQYYQADERDRINQSGDPIDADQIAPVTQLFTEDYMVAFLLHNTIGAWWARKSAPIKATNEAEARAQIALESREGLGIDWQHLRLIQNEQNEWQPVCRFDGWPQKASEITFLDPCMGSGIFCVFVLRVLVRLRMEEENLSLTDAVHAVLRDNLHGLEIDSRCAQIAAFNIAFTAWKLIKKAHPDETPLSQRLPKLNIACCGFAPNATREQWLDWVGEDDKLRNGMAHLHKHFAEAPLLGSLIDPKASLPDDRAQDDYLSVSKKDFAKLHPLLKKALDKEIPNEPMDYDLHERKIKAEGIARAAEILEKRFTLIATNVPFLGRGRQCQRLRDYCARHHPEAKADLATCFVDRSVSLLQIGGTAALVTPQNWLFLKSYQKLRKKLLREISFDCIARLGVGAFQTISGEVVNAILFIMTNGKKGGMKRAQRGHQADGKLVDVAVNEMNFVGLDVSKMKTPNQKALALQSQIPTFPNQKAQLKNPDQVITFEKLSHGTLLSKYADYAQGGSIDVLRFRQRFWEIPAIENEWVFHQSSPTLGHYSGMSFVTLCKNRDEYFGKQAWGKIGIMGGRMRHLPASIYIGNLFDNNASAIIPKNQKHLSAIWCFMSSPEYYKSVRKIDQALKVASATMTKIPFDLEKWERVAGERYPEGLPKPFSKDPTQWLFGGHPKETEQTLHVAMARLAGYRWPRQTGSAFPDCPAIEKDGLEEFADEDGILPLHGSSRKYGVARRLREMLVKIFGEDFDEVRLLKQAGSNKRRFEEWLQDEFFLQHCRLFHNRPFIWHIWDGHPEGFGVLVNYHCIAQPDYKGNLLLQNLTYSYLREWIDKQRDEKKENILGAEERLTAAEILKSELEKILVGEAPYDLFVRWKPFHQQAKGWHPDLNDGVRLNIRPFLKAHDVGRKGAGILRIKPNLHWKKDRGNEPKRNKKDFPWFYSWNEKDADFMGGESFDGNRWNDLHYSLACKNR